MEHKKDLARIALAALILASATPANGQTYDISEGEGIFLASGCPHGCPGKPSPKNGIEDNAKSAEDGSEADKKSTTSDQNDKTKNVIADQAEKSDRGNSKADKRSHSIQNDKANSDQLKTQKDSQKGTKAQDIYAVSTYEDNSRYTYPYPKSSYDSQRSGVTSPVYMEDRISNTYDTRPSPYKEYGGMTNLNRDYNTVSGYDYNRAVVTTSTSLATLTEAQLFGLLSDQGREIYLNLDPEGKALAFQLASEESYRDKNLAMKEAQRRMNERRGIGNR
jgi:hypothetical protein